MSTLLALKASVAFEALQKIANGEGYYGAQAAEYKRIARDALEVIEKADPAPEPLPAGIEWRFKLPFGGFLDLLVRCEVYEEFMAPRVEVGEVYFLSMKDGEYHDTADTILGKHIKRSLERDSDFCEYATEQAGWEWSSNGRAGDLSASGRWVRS